MKIRSISMEDFIEGQQEYHSFLRTNGADVTFHTYEHVNHTITDQMIDNIKRG